jgi:hemolysin-activating ACP:hemolysin acyltransferase
MGVQLSSEAPRSRAEAVGRIIAVCAEQKAYLHRTVSQLYDSFFPAIDNDQFRIFLADGKDVGFITWAFLAYGPSVYQRLGFDPRQYEWRSGHEMWIQDLALADGIMPLVIRHLREEVFTAEYFNRLEIPFPSEVYGVRRFPDSKLRRTFRLKDRWGALRGGATTGGSLLD